MQATLRVGGGLTGTAVVHLLIALAAMQIFRAAIPQLQRPSSFHIDTFGIAFTDAIFQVLGTTSRDGPGDSSDGAGVSDRHCPANPPLDSFAEPAGGLHQGRPLVWTSAGHARDPWLCVRINADGRIDSLRFISRSGDPATDRDTIDALLSLAFRPASADGQARPEWRRISVPLGIRGYHYATEPARRP